MKEKAFLSILVLFTASFLLSIILDIYLYRQILGFFTCSYFIGFIVIYILQIKNINTTKLVLYSIGISISFLMLFGYILNEIYYYFGYNTPLSAISLSLSISAILLFMILFSYFQNNKSEINISPPKYKLNLIEKVLISFSIILSILGIYGTIVMEYTDNNSYILLLYILIILLVTTIGIFNSKISSQSWPLLIYFIGFSLVWGYALRSNYVMGDDVIYSYYMFKHILANLHWSILENNPLSGCLSITLLPAMYSSLLNMEGQHVFKLLYPMLFSFTPLIIYELSKKYVAEHYAFLASFFFMIQHSFLQPSYEARTIVAIFFVALSIMAILDDQIDFINKKILFILFTLSIIVSHYSTAYIYFFTIVFMSFSSYIYSYICDGKQAIPKYTKIMITLPILFLVLLFLWFSQIIGSSFNSGVNFISHIIESNNMLLLDSHSDEVSSLVGIGIAQKSLPQNIEFILTWVILITIGIGMIYIMVDLKKNGIGLKNNSETFIKHSVNINYFSLMVCSISLLFIFVIMPFISEGYSMQRIYCQTSIILSLVFIIGAIFISTKLKISPVLLILLLTLPYFLSVTGVTYELYGSPKKLELNSENNLYYTYSVVH